MFKEPVNIVHNHFKQYFKQIYLTHKETQTDITTPGS